MPHHHIVLTGAMGVGKTTLGSLLAGRLELPFIDSDERLQADHHQSARKIAQVHGVRLLHALEHSLVRTVVSTDEPTVLAAAASIADDVGLLEGVVQTRSRLIYLVAEPADLLARSGRETHRRSIEPAEALALTRLRRTNAEAAGAALFDTSGGRTPEQLVVALAELVAG